MSDAKKPRITNATAGDADPALRQAQLQSTLKTQACTSLRLRQLTRRVSHHYDLEMAKVGLKTTQYSLLTCVSKFGPLRPGELAQFMKLSASTLTRNLKPLVDAGWVDMGAGSDARSRTVSITPAGLAKRQEGRTRWKAAQQTVNELLGAERVLALHQLITESLDLLAADGLLDPED